MVLIYEEVTSTAYIESQCFRPLAGIMVLIYILKKLFVYPDGQFPSPCGDYGSYQNIDN